MITDPKGIDLPIQTLQIQFADHLFSGSTYSSNGRAFLDDWNEGLTPKVMNEFEYEDVLTDDLKDAISFFLVEPDITIQGLQANATVNIHFFVALSALIVTQEAVRILVQTEINNSPFQIVNYFSGRESVKDFTIRRPELLEMQPYHCFKFECTITYKLC
jgi:hypothetical protein